MKKIIIFISLFIIVLLSIVVVGLSVDFTVKTQRSVSTIPEIIENYPQECITEVIPEKNRMAMLDIYITRLEACKTRALIKELHKKD